MKTLLLLSAALLMTVSVARADHIGIYSDATGASCLLATGFTSSVAVVHKFSLGATGSLFKLELPAESNLFAFSTTYAMVGSVQSSAAINYGTCLQGSFFVGWVVAILTPGDAWVRPADGLANVMVADCAFVESAATCGGAFVGYPGGYGCPSCQIVPTDQKTWGAVKALYRD